MNSDLQLSALTNYLWKQAISQLRPSSVLQTSGLALWKTNMAIYFTILTLYPQTLFAAWEAERAETRRTWLELGVRETENKIKYLSSPKRQNQVSSKVRSEIIPKKEIEQQATLSAVATNQNHLRTPERKSPQKGSLMTASTLPAVQEAQEVNSSMILVKQESEDMFAPVQRNSGQNCRRCWYYIDNVLSMQDKVQKLQRRHQEQEDRSKLDMLKLLATIENSIQKSRRESDLQFKTVIEMLSSMSTCVCCQQRQREGNCINSPMELSIEFRRFFVMNQEPPALLQKDNSESVSMRIIQREYSGSHNSSCSSDSMDRVRRYQQQHANMINQLEQWQEEANRTKFQ